MTSKKTIIVGIPYFNQLNVKIVQNLQQLGYDTIDISFDTRFKYPSLWHKIWNAILKLTTRKTHYKTSLRFAPHRQGFEQLLNTLPRKVDFILLIRPDIYPIDFIRKIKQHTHCMVGYQWDGLSIFPDVKDYIPYFDRFFIFDPSDVQKGLLSTSNFYFTLPENLPSTPHKKQVYFVGTFLKERVLPLQKLTQAILQTEYKPMLFLYSKKTKVIEAYKNSSLAIITEIIPFEKNVQYAMESEVLVDILNEDHQGLSFRTFEAFKYHKKLITNNPTIKNYDFYNEANILVIEKEEDYEKVASFLQTKYISPSEEIYHKYSFDNWIKYMLNLPDHIPMNLPQKK